MHVTLMYFDNCPNWKVAHGRLTALSDELAFDLDLTEVTTQVDAERLDFRGSPSILVNGVDVFAKGDEPVGLSCRVFQTPEGLAGSPTDWQLRTVLST